MGSKCAPSVACVYMGDFERQHLSNLPTQQQKLLIWLTYIDDIFAIWPHGQDSLLKFNSWLNSRHPRIQFTCVCSNTSVDFLDTTVKLINGSLQTELFIKPTSSLSYLHRNSCHPTHVFQALPYREFLRVRKNCSTLDSFDHFSDIILEAFTQRGNDSASLLRAQSQARGVDRPSLLAHYANLEASHRTDSNNLSYTSDQFFFVLEHHPKNPKIHQFLRRNWAILGTSDITSDLYDSKLTCGARRNPRLRGLLVCSSIPLKPTFGKKGKSTISPIRPTQPHSWHNSGHESHSGVYHQTQQHQRSTRNAPHYWARVELPTPDQSPPWPQCDGLTVWVTLCFQAYCTFFNPMHPMGLSRGLQTLSHLSLILW